MRQKNTASYKPYNRPNQAGYSLISLAFLILLLGLFSHPAIQLYKLWQERNATITTAERMQAIENAIQVFLMENGRYPCAAPLDAPLDSDRFGLEVTDVCTVDDHAGTFRSQGRSDRIVRTGTVPVRTLGLPDEWITDGWRHRFVYAITEEYAQSGAPLDSDNGAIAVQDGEGNNATAIAGNLIHILLSMGPDTRGAYSLDGVQLAPCDTASVAGANCDFNDATFTNTVARARKTGENHFTHRITYRIVTMPKACSEEGEATGLIPGNIAYLTDTSGSMSFRGSCPPEMGNACSRIDVARWALRRVIPARLLQSETEDNPGTTDLTGFVDTEARNAAAVERRLGDTSIETQEDAESKIERLCPNGNTPLGVHIEALADRLGDGEPDRPNVIMVISDGLSNRGTDPVVVARRIAANYPNLQVHIVDVVGNDSLKLIAEITGGQYHFTQDSQSLLDSLFRLTGTCKEMQPPEPEDKPGCGSTGNWWR